MILQALNRYYELLQERDNEQLPGEAYSEAAVSFEIHLERDGRVTAVLPYQNEKGKPDKRNYQVPKQEKRANGINPYFLCDKAEYLFGVSIGLRAACREGMKELWTAVLDHAPETEEVMATRKFLGWTSDQLQDMLNRIVDSSVLESLGKGGLCVLKYSPTGRMLHQNGAIKAAWERYYGRIRTTDSEGNAMVCLITGESMPRSQIARLHPNIKNVVGAQTAGAAIVSFNKDSFCSYGLDQSFNAPTSTKAADAYAYVLNRFLADPMHKVRMNDTTVVFWAETASTQEQDFLSSLLQDMRSSDSEADDESSVQARVRSAVVRIREGRPFHEIFSDLNQDTAFYVLGLSPNAARLAVRFWYTGSLGEIGEQVWRHYGDLSVQGLDRSPSVRELLRELAVRGEWDNIPPNMEGQMLRSILLGQPYPRSIFTQLMNRIRADSDEGKVNARRAGLIKACLLRFARRNGNQEWEANLTMSLNEQSTSTAYHLGRLFACLEKTQMSALGRQINATIRDRFWGAASATPALVFPRLLHVAQHHISKDEDWGHYNDNLIQNVMNVLPDQFPQRLTLEEQGMFALGYYQQRQAFYKTTPQGKPEQ